MEHRIFYVDPRFHPTLLGWNMGLTWKFLMLADVKAYSPLVVEPGKEVGAVPVGVVDGPITIGPDHFRLVCIHQLIQLRHCLVLSNIKLRSFLNRDKHTPSMKIKITSCIKPILWTGRLVWNNIKHLTARPLLHFLVPANRTDPQACIMQSSFETEQWASKGE